MLRSYIDAHVKSSIEIVEKVFFCFRVLFAIFLSNITGQRRLFATTSSNAQVIVKKKKKKGKEVGRVEKRKNKNRNTHERERTFKHDAKMFIKTHWTSISLLVH